MSVVIVPQLITAIGSFTALTNSSADYLQLDPQRCALPAQGAARVTLEPKAGADDVFVEDAFEGEQILTLAGDVVITSVDGPGASYFQAIKTLIGTLKTDLAAMKAADHNLVCDSVDTPCRWYGPLDTSWSNFYVCAVTFSLVVHPS